MMKKSYVPTLELNFLSLYYGVLKKKKQSWNVQTLCGKFTFYPYRGKITLFQKLTLTFYIFCTVYSIRLYIIYILTTWVM